MKNRISMKFLSILSLSMAIITAVNGQYWSPVGTALRTFSTSHVIVDGDLEFEHSHPSSGSAAIRSIKGNTDNYLQIYGNTGPDFGPSLFLFTNSLGLHNSYSDPGMVSIWSNGTTTSDRAFEILNHPPFSTDYTPLVQVTNGGNMGLGSTNLSERLNIDGNIGFTTSSTPGVYRTISANSDESGLYLNSNTEFTDGSSIIMKGGNQGSIDDGQILFISNSGLSNSGGGFLFTRYNTSSDLFEERMEITESGAVLIGNVTGNSSYKLFVEKGILTEKLKVANKSDYINWSDFVFDKDYNLMPLDKLDSYISENHHLPEIPTADDVRKDGIDIAEINAKLLQKIEELTLYVIQQQKEINVMKTKLKSH